MIIPSLKSSAVRWCLLLFTTAFLFISCGSGKQDNGPERPYDPWAFRSVLDENPRILTLALHDDLWVAYHTDSCSFYKAWKGRVKFQGAVYDQAHGPQPISIGNAWLLNPYKQPWQVMKSGQDVLDSVRYGGHSVEKGRVTLHFDLVCTDGQTIRVNESPEYIDAGENQAGFERLFSLEDAPDGYEVSIAQQATSIALASNCTTNGQWTIEQEEKSTVDNKQLLIQRGRLILNADEPTYFRIAFAGKPTIENPNGSGDEDELLPLGERLIAKSDCKTCHNIKLATVGPSYQQIADRYPNDEETVSMLVKKVIEGGSGIWGIQAMAPHPDLAVTDAQEMVRYILGLSAEAENGASSSVQTFTANASRQDGEGLLPGLLVEVWTNQRGFENIPTISSSVPANQAGIITDFHAIDAVKFGELTEDFVLHANGYVNIDKDMEAGFRLWSDDGSRLTLNGQVIISNDGMHGTESQEAIVKLSKGYHAIFLEFMQGKGGRYLSLEWKPKDSVTWQPIPTELFTHPADGHDKLKGKSLAMMMGKLIPGDKSPLVSVHPSYDLSQARPDDFFPKVGGMDFMSDGTLIISTWDQTGSVYRLSNVDSGDPSKITVKKIASGFAEPLGLSVVNDTIYVLQKQELTRLIDRNGDQVMDVYECVNNEWPTSANFHEFAFGLAEKDNGLYATLAIAIQPGGASTEIQKSSRGKCVRWDLPSGKMHYLAHGFRTPNGIGVGVDGEIFVADNQGDWLPSSKILHITQDAFFGSRAVDFEGTADLKVKQPMLWLPQNEIGNSPSTPLALNDGPYAGQMIHCEVTHGGVKRDFIEKVNGEYQGCVFRFIQGLEAGINRMTWGPDGALYVGGIGNPGDWGQADKLWFGLQRLKYNGKPTFEMLAVRAKTDGLEIEFTEPLNERDGWDVQDWEVRQWRYVPTENYGGPKIDDVALKVAAASVSADRKKVSLKLEGMKAGHVVYVHLKDAYVSDNGLPIWSTEAWYTMNQIPQNNPVEIRAGNPPADNTLTAAEQLEGWELLFDGQTTAGWHTFKKDRIGASWIVQDGALMLDAKKNPEGHWQAADGGDITTKGEYENFELYLEWKIAPCGNSGIIYSSVESADYDYAWQTGPEMQVLDDVCHPDARIRTHRAGDLYDMIECQYTTVKPAGQWNRVRLIKQDGHVEHWLNGVKVVEFDMYTDEWNEMIANSKFKDMKGFGQARKGHIVLQDHGDRVWYKNIRIRRLDDKQEDPG